MRRGRLGLVPLGGGDGRRGARAVADSAAAISAFAAAVR